MLEQIPDWQSMTAEQIVDYLAEVVSEPTNKMVKVSDIESAVGFQAANLVIGTIEQAASQMPILRPVLTAMSTTGLDLSSPNRQAVIDQLAVAGSWPDEVRDAVKSLGVRTGPRWQSLGLAELPTVAQVQAAIDESTKEPDSQSHEVLLSANRSADGRLNVVARVTPVGLLDGKVIQRGEATSIVNEASLTEAVTSLIEGLI